MSVSNGTADCWEVSDWAELAEMQRMRLATSANSGNSRPFSFHNSSTELCSAGTRIAIYLARSSWPDARLWFVGWCSFIHWFAIPHISKWISASYLCWWWTVICFIIHYVSDGYQKVVVVATNIYQCCLALSHIWPNSTQPNPSMKEYSVTHLHNCNVTTQNIARTAQTKLNSLSSMLCSEPCTA